MCVSDEGRCQPTGTATGVIARMAGSYSENVPPTGHAPALAEVSNDGFVEVFAVEPGGVVVVRQSPVCEPVCGLRIDLVLDRLYARCEFVGGFIGIDGESPLQDSWPGIEIIGHEVHSAAVPGVAGIEYALVCVQSRKRRQQRRVNIENPACVMVHEPRTEDAHITCEEQQLGFGFVEHLRHGAIK